MQQHVFVAFKVKNVFNNPNAIAPLNVRLNSLKMPGNALLIKEITQATQNTNNGLFNIKMERIIQLTSSSLKRQRRQWR